MRLKQALVALLVVVLLFGRPVAVDASWAGMLVQVAAVLSQIRGYVQTAEAYVAQAHAEMRGLLDPGGLVSGVRSLADWRGVLAELTDLGPLWEPFPETRALVSDAAANYQAVRGLGGHDFGSVAGFVDFLDSQPFGWTAGKESAWQVLVDDLGVPAELRDEVRSAEQLRRRVIDLRTRRRGTRWRRRRSSAARSPASSRAGPAGGRRESGAHGRTRMVGGPIPTGVESGEADSAASHSPAAPKAAGALSLRPAFRRGSGRQAGATAPARIAQSGLGRWPICGRAEPGLGGS